MPCEGYQIALGDFNWEGEGWSQDSRYGWSLLYDGEYFSDQGDHPSRFRYRLMKNFQCCGYLTFDIDSEFTRNAYSEKWIFFGGGQFLAIYAKSPAMPGPDHVNGDQSYNIRICDLRNLTPSSPAEIPFYRIGLCLGLNETIHFHSSPDGMAFFICVDIPPDSTHPAGYTAGNTVYRSDARVTLCYRNAIGNDQPVSGERNAKIILENGVRYVEIITRDGRVWQKCALTGRCVVDPSVLDFGETVLSPDADTSVKKQFLISNGTESNPGKNVLGILSITDAVSFTVEAASHDLPACLDLLEQMAVTVKFNPTAIGVFDAELIVNCSPEVGARYVKCKGSCREPIARFVMPKSGPLDFGQVHRGLRSVRAVPIGNKGDALLVFLACIEGPDKHLFGLMTASSTVDKHVYVVNARRPYDGTPSGSGQTDVHVIFKAVGLPRPVKARIDFYGPFGPQDPSMLELGLPGHRRIDEAWLRSLPELGRLQLIGQVGPPLVPIIPD